MEASESSEHVEIVGVPEELNELAVSNEGAVEKRSKVTEGTAVFVMGACESTTEFDKTEVFNARDGVESLREAVPGDDMVESVMFVYDALLKGILQLEIESELVVTVIGILELDLLPRLEVIEKLDELDIGYNTLLELELKSRPDVVVLPLSVTICLVMLLLELVEASRLVDGETLVETEGSPDLEALNGTTALIEGKELVEAFRLVDGETLVKAEECLIFEAIDGAGELTKDKELINAEVVVDVAPGETAGLKMTLAKMSPKALLRL